MGISWKSFAAGFAAASLICTASAVWLIRKLDRSSQQWVMPSATFMDMGEDRPGSGYVQFAGSLGGKEPIATPFNIFQGRCAQAEGVCHTEYVQKIGPSHLSDIDVTTFKIVSWTSDLIVADSDENSPACVTIRLNLRRRAQIVEYVRAPRSPLPDNVLCGQLDQTTKVWSVGNPPGR